MAERDTRIAYFGYTVDGKMCCNVEWNYHVSTPLVAVDESAESRKLANETASAINRAYQRGWDDAMSAMRELLGIKEEE